MNSFVYSAAVKKNPLLTTVAADDVKDQIKTWLGNARDRGDGRKNRYEAAKTKGLAKSKNVGHSQHPSKSMRHSPMQYLSGSTSDSDDV